MLGGHFIRNSVGSTHMQDTFAHLADARPGYPFLVCESNTVVHAPHHDALGKQRLAPAERRFYREVLCSRIYTIGATGSQAYPFRMRNS